MHYYDSDLKLDQLKIDKMPEEEKINRLMTQFKMDKNRMLVILLTRLLKRLIIKSKIAINLPNNVHMDALKTFCLVAEEFILMPLIAAG